MLGWVPPLDVAGARACAVRFDNFGTEDCCFPSTSAFLWFVASVLRRCPHPCGYSREEESEVTPGIFVETEPGGRSDDDRDCPIRQRVTPTKKSPEAG